MEETALMRGQEGGNATDLRKWEGAKNVRFLIRPRKPLNVVSIPEEQPYITRRPLFPVHESKITVRMLGRGRECDATFVIAANGGWGKWSEWSERCDSEGEKSRRRTCDRPTPFNGGKPCSGKELETKKCPPRRVSAPPRKCTRNVVTIYV